MRATYRRLRLLFRLGLAVLLMTVAAVIYQDQVVKAQTVDGAALRAPADAAIVLGAGVSGDGQLAYNSRRRVAAAVALLEAGRVQNVIFSGGLGFYHPATPAASLMRDYAAELGADRRKLIIEPRSVSTFENLRYSFEIAEARGFDRLVIVSDAYHLTRAGWISAFYGRPDMPISAARGFEHEWWPYRGVTYTREALSWWLNWVKFAGWEGLGLMGMSETRRADYVR
ncbi:MAG: YdcF family protein [Pikeienuella sp.]